GDAGDRRRPQARLAGPRLLSPGTHGRRRAALPDAEVPDDAGRRRGRERPGLGAGGRPAPHCGRRLPAPDEPRRAPAALQRAAGRDEPGGTAPGAPELRRGLSQARARLHAPSQDEGGNHRLGPDQRLARQHVDREADRVRPVLHRALEPRLRSEDPLADHLGRLPHQPQRALSRARDWLLRALTVGLAASITLSETTLVVLAVVLVAGRLAAPERPARRRPAWPLLGPLLVFASWTLVVALASAHPGESLLASRGL